MSTSTWRAIADSIRNDIVSGRLRAGDRLPGEETVAAEWGVSRQTAHKGLAELHRQGYVIRKRRWGTVVAESLPDATAGRYTLLVDHFAYALNYPAAELMRGLHDGLGPEATIVVAESAEDPDREIRTLRRAVEDGQGTLLVPLTNPKNTPAIQRIADSGHPFVVMDRLPVGLRADLVTSDNEGATASAIDALAVAGHRHVGFFSFHRPAFSTVTERYRSFAQACERNGMADPTPYERWFENHLESDHPRFVQAIHDSLFTLLHGPRPVTAIFCVQDSLAQGVVQAAERMGANVPRDLEIATFNDWPAMMLRSADAMHRIRQRPYDMGLAAARLLATPRSAGSEYRSERVPAELHRPSAVPVIATFRSSSRAVPLAA